MVHGAGSPRQARTTPKPRPGPFRWLSGHAHETLAGFRGMLRRSNRSRNGQRNAEPERRAGRHRVYRCPRQPHPAFQPTSFLVAFAGICFDSRRATEPLILLGRAVSSVGQSACLTSRIKGFLQVVENAAKRLQNQSVIVKVVYPRFPEFTLVFALGSPQFPPQWTRGGGVVSPIERAKRCTVRRMVDSSERCVRQMSWTDSPANQRATSKASRSRFAPPSRSMERTFESYARI